MFNPFNKEDTKFVLLLKAIDERLRLYEKLLSEGDPDKFKPEVHKSLEILAQEFRNLKIRSWQIQSGEDVSKLIKDMKEEEVLAKLEEREEK